MEVGRSDENKTPLPLTGPDAAQAVRTVCGRKEHYKKPVAESEPRPLRFWNKVLPYPLPTSI